MKYTELPIPEHFDRKKADSVCRVDYSMISELAVEWKNKYQILPSSKDKKKTCLFLIDVQNTFCIPGFELFVAGRDQLGAVKDNIRLCEFIYKNLKNITQICATMDTHRAFQIFYPVFFVDKNNNHPKPMTVITAEDIENKRWFVNPGVLYNLEDVGAEFLKNQVEYYIKKVSEKGKFELIIWPYHAMLGGIGHSVVSIVEEALFFHNMARSSQTDFEIKGNNPLTESYSALCPEVLKGYDLSKIAVKNVKLIKKLLSYDRVVIAGQAKSHCVRWTIEDLLEEIKKVDKGLTEKIYILEDCTSSVVVPGVADFTDSANEAFLRFRREGVNIVKSAVPMNEWGKK